MSRIQVVHANYVPVILSPCASSFPGGMYTLHFSTSAHMEKAEKKLLSVLQGSLKMILPLAIGPKVPAINGEAVDANHH
jgi:hypothetical protein